MDFDSDSSSDSEADFVDDVRQVRPRPRLFRERENHFEKYDDIDFKLRFRLSKRAGMHLLELIGDDIQRRTNRTQPVTALMQLLVTLRFYATGTFQKVLGDLINLSQPTVCRIIPRVTSAIAALGQNYIQMPASPAERRRTMADFHNIGGFPGVVGAIDCTHIKIQSPGGPNAELYRNRKGWFSYNVQVVCDANLRFNNVIARWPGSVHDSTIMNDSPLRVEFESGDYPECYLLGDGGYACKAYLLTPLLHPQTPAEQNYNRAHIRTRNPIERAFGVWKRVFPCLSLGMRIKKRTALHVIVATAVLHNIRIDLRENLPNDVVHEEVGAVDLDELNDYDADNDFSVRNALIETVFNRA